MDEEGWAPSFQPGWPNVFPIGLTLMRSAVHYRSEPKEDLAQEPEVTFLLHAAASQQAPRFAITGELTVADAYSFAGAIVVLPLLQREEPEEFEQADADDLLKQYGEWAAPLIYDFAAASLRSQLAATGMLLEVPRQTARPQLVIDE